jgi:hypothetical protein
MFYGKVRATKISEASLRIVSDEFSNSMETSISASHLTSSKREVANWHGYVHQNIECQIERRCQPIAINDMDTMVQIHKFGDHGCLGSENFGF